eukprot:TRINITY_DN37876_c0_g1_i1.p1 TRINITY_DN37876_c0_g1~~TRINITY_DN37876_c0_g1_i1.p1  ORF type:complete len:348 (-),score=57.57 TRINITY_DN37876_c0_g1_i1:153-1151(-)
MKAKEYYLAVACGAYLTVNHIAEWSQFTLKGGHHHDIVLMEFLHSSADGQSFVSLDSSGTLVCWDLHHRKQVHRLDLAIAEVHGMCVLMNSDVDEVLVWGRKPQTSVDTDTREGDEGSETLVDCVGVWSLEDGELSSQPRISLDLGGDLVTKCCVSPNNRYIAIACKHSRIRIYRSNNGNESAVLSHNLSGNYDQWPCPVWDIHFSKDNSMLVSGHEDGVVNLWRVGGDWPLFSRIMVHFGPVRHVRTLNNGELLLTGSDDSWVHVHDIRGNDEIVEMTAFPLRAGCASLQVSRHGDLFTVTDAVGHAYMIKMVGEGECRSLSMMQEEVSVS